MVAMLGNPQVVKFSKMQLDAQIYLGARVESLFGCLRYYNTSGIKFDAAVPSLFLVVATVCCSFT